ncbi:MAG TPA: phytanoyl-CoA dioxygenase family protein [Burkholderiales bacterium]|nr:phytanoyl-CoA dioxygenase family protein [Burkholderiales bacterium]
MEVPHLFRLWSRTRKPDSKPEDAREAAADELTIHGLGLELHETWSFLYSRPSTFHEFECWVLERNGGKIDPARIAEVKRNAEKALSDMPLSWPPLPENFSPVLSEDDLAFWEENGYIVLKKAVPKEDCEAAEAAIWEFTGMHPENPETWYEGPQGHSVMVQLVHHPAFEKNRASPRIRAAFAELWETEDLQVTIDRGGFNPPERPDWPFPGPHLHWDTSISLPMPKQLQGILYLTDTPAHQGAFCCVPGFHRRLESWLASIAPGEDPRKEALLLDSFPVAAEAGDFIIWHAGLPHGASPNRGLRPRIVQYISMYPPGMADGRPWI